MIKQAGYRDVFKLADEGYLQSKEGADYVPKVLAAMIIISNPELVAE